MKTTHQSQLRFDSFPCTGAPSNQKILREENRHERARRAYITCAERNHHAAGTSRAHRALLNFYQRARRAYITCAERSHHAAGTSRARSVLITFSSPAHLVVLYEMATNYGLTSGDEKKRHSNECLFGFRQLPIFPGRLQPSIVGVCALNFCVRNGNRWDRTA